MADKKGSLSPATALIRACVWAQLIGYLALVAMMCIEDAPDFFARASVMNLLWPTLILILMHLFQLDMRIAVLIPSIWIITGLMLLSLSTLMAIAVGVWLSFSIPESLVSSGWEYTQTTSIIALILYLGALGITMYFSIQTVRSSKED